MMKHIKLLRASILLFTILAFGCNSNSQESSTQTQAPLAEKVINPNEISWKANIQEALAEAKSRGELLFVECYSPTCPYCTALEPYFKMPEVASLYNKNFISYKLNVTEANQVSFLNDKDIWLPSFPMFLFFDGDGNLVHQSSVDPSIESVNGIAEEAINPETRAGNYSKRFADGERDVEFLADYASFTRVIKDTAAGLEAADALYEVYPKGDLATETSWKLTKKAVSDIDNGFAKHWFNHTTEAGVFEAKEGHPDNQNNILGGILQSSLYSPRGREYTYAKLTLLRSYMSNIGAGQYADNVLWEFEVKALIRENKASQALAIGKKMIAAFGSNGSAHVYVVRVFNDHYPNAEHVATAKSWLANALPSITQDNVRAEYYYEVARLNQKAGEITAAKENAQAAQALAVKISASSSKFAELIESLN